MAGFVFGDNLFSILDMVLLHLLALCDLCPLSLLVVFLLVPWRLVILRQGFFDSRWIEYFGGEGIY